MEVELLLAKQVIFLSVMHDCNSSGFWRALKVCTTAKSLANVSRSADFQTAREVSIALNTLSGIDTIAEKILSA